MQPVELGLDIGKLGLSSLSTGLQSLGAIDGGKGRVDLGGGVSSDRSRIRDISLEGREVSHDTLHEFDGELENESDQSLVSGAHCADP